MSNVEIWIRASELYASHGRNAKKFAYRKAIQARWNDDGNLYDDWLLVASRVGAVASLSALH